MFKVQNTLAILTASAAMLIMACDGTASSEEILLPQEAETNSSSIDSTASSSSVDSAAGNSSQDSGASSSSEAISSSSQEPSSSTESSSQAASSDSDDQISKMDKLPFDTTGIDPDTLHYTYILDEFKDETVIDYYKTEYGENLEYYVLVTVGDGHYCHIGSGSAGGQGDYQNVYTTQTPTEYIFMENRDSLLFTYVENCATLSWDGCHEPKSNNAFMQKIMVGNDTFYYSELEKWLQLAKVTDSSVIVWEKKTSSNESTTTAKKFAWDKSDFENDTLVKFISDDTIFIETYNLKITDNEDTWIFGDEVCSTLGYKKVPGMTDEESCKALETFHNEAIRCRQRNLNITSPRLFPTLCRPNYGKKSDIYTWCILDEDLESKLKYAI